MTQEKYTDITQMTFQTLGELMRDSVSKFGARPFLGVKTNGSYQWMTYAEFGTVVRKFRSLLKEYGIKKGDRIAVIAGNSVEFAAAAYASYGLGGIIVPMYEVQKKEDWEYIISDAQPTIVIVQNPRIQSTIEEFQCESIKKILTVCDAEGGRALRAQIDAHTEELEIDTAITADDVCDIIYTSGTTGKPRGVVLSHRAVCDDVRITISRFYITEIDRAMTFLPWAHAFGKTVELHLLPSAGVALGLAESTKTIADNLKEVNPTVLISVPQIFNKIYDKVNVQLDSGIKKVFRDQILALGQMSKNGSFSLLRKLQHRILDMIVASKVRAAFGNSLRFCISGGASLSREVADFFDAFGVRIYEGYGMTEHAPVVAVNNPEVRHVGSVGRPLDGVKVEILHDNDQLDQSDEKCGEIVISSTSVMKSYYNDETATLAAIDDQGRLHTGDMGYLDEAGCLWITGRVKEQYKLENGKYVVPTALEEKINNSPMIGLSVVFGAGRPYNVALIQPSEECMAKFKAEHQLENASNEELENNAQLRSLIQSELEQMTSEFRGYEKPRKFAVTLGEISIRNGLLTPALKIRRRPIEQQYKDVLNSLYE